MVVIFPHTKNSRGKLIPVEFHIHVHSTSVNANLNELEVYTSGAFDWQQTEQWSLVNCSSSYLAKLPNWNCAVPIADSRSLV